MSPPGNPKRPPLAAPRSPSVKENLGTVQLDKMRIVLERTTKAAANSAHSQNVLFAVNSGPGAASYAPGGDPACSDGGSIADGEEFSSREDVERLLNDKMKCKHKSNFKEKIAMLTEYVKKLKGWFEEREDGLRSTLKSLGMRYADRAGRAMENEEWLNSELATMKLGYTSLEESFKQEQEHKLSAIDCHNKETKRRSCVEKSRDALSEELRKAKQEAVIAEQQIKSLQDLNKNLQEYNRSLQQYNSKIQNDVAANSEMIAKLHKEKTTMAEALSSSRAHCILLQEQLSSPRVCLTLNYDIIKSASAITQTLSNELAEGQCKLLSLAAAGNSKSLDPVTTQQSKGAMVKASFDPTKELTRLISECQYDEAFNIALDRGNASIVSWLCSQVDLKGILYLKPLVLSQGVLLSLLQHLSCDLGKDTSQKIAWMTRVAVSINPADPRVALQVRRIFKQVYQILAHQRSLPTTTAAESCSICLLMLLCHTS